MPRSMLDQPSEGSDRMGNGGSLSFKRLRHEWTSEHRIFLCVFLKVFSNDVDQAEIFSHCFKDVLRMEGFESGFPYSSIAAQLRDMKRIGTPGNDVFTDVCFSSIKEVRKRFRAVKETIEDVALDLGIELRLRVVESQSIQLSPPKKQRQADREGENMLGDFTSSGEDTETASIRHQSRHRKCHIFAQTKRTPRSNQTEVHPGAHISNAPTPRVLFRFYDDASAGVNGRSFRAGLFVDENTPMPDPITGIELRERAITHLTPKNEPTPFISFFQNILPAMHRAFRSGKNAYVAIIDLQLVVSSHRRYFKSNNERSVQYVRVLCKEMGFSFGPNEYVGGGEWLIYGFVDEPSVVGTICINELSQNSAQFTALSSILQLDLITAAKNAGGLRPKLRRRTSAMNFDAGVIVGQLLRRLPDEYKEIVADNIRQNFELVAHSPQAYEDYVKGVYHSGGARRERSISIHDRAQEEDLDTSILSESDQELAQESGSDNSVTGENDSPISFRAVRTVSVAYSEDWLRSPGPPHQRNVSAISVLDTFTKELLEEAKKCTPAPANNAESVEAWKAPLSHQSQNTPSARYQEDEGISPKRRIEIIDLTDETREREVMETSPPKKRKTTLAPTKPKSKAGARISRFGGEVILPRRRLVESVVQKRREHPAEANEMYRDAGARGMGRPEGNRRHTG